MTKRWWKWDSYRGIASGVPKAALEWIRLQALDFEIQASPHVAKDKGYFRISEKSQAGADRGIPPFKKRRVSYPADQRNARKKV